MEPKERSSGHWGHGFEGGYETPVLFLSLFHFLVLR
jgi:hypothetical protein